MKASAWFRTISYVIIAILLIGMFIVIPLVELYEKINLFPNKDQSILSIYSAFLIILTFFLVIVTAALVYVAYTQLESSRQQLEYIGKSARADFLMRLDDRYGSEEIIKARQIIQKMYRESKNIKRNGEVPEIIHRNYIAEKINEYASDVKKSDEYVYLLNLLDFLETISFFTNKGFIERKDIGDLMGLSLDFFYTIFLPRIEARRGKYGDKSIYSEFEKLAKQARNSQPDS